MGKWIEAVDSALCITYAGKNRIGRFLGPILLYRKIGRHMYHSFSSWQGLSGLVFELTHSSLFTRLPTNACLVDYTCPITLTLELYLMGIIAFMLSTSNIVNFIPVNPALVADSHS